ALGPAPTTEGSDTVEPPRPTVPLRARAGALGNRGASPAQAPEPRAETATQPVGPPISGYEILSVLGRGGMAVGYKARQVGLDRVVALKMIGNGLGDDAEQLARFRGEAELIARLQHPNIIQVYEVGTSVAGPFFAMELADAGNLQDLWAGNPQPPRAVAA